MIQLEIVEGSVTAHQRTPAGALTREIINPNHVTFHNDILINVFGTVTIGRDATCDIVCNRTCTSVSRTHCRLIKYLTHWEVEDLHSRFGTRLQRDGQGELLIVKAPMRIERGDLLMLGAPGDTHVALKYL